MLKRIFLSLLTLALLCGLLGACGNTATPPADPSADIADPNHPGNDDTLSILMVGNSACYYYVEELYGLLIANPDPNRGYSKVQIFNLYYSGCAVSQHLNWWLNDQAPYNLFKTDENGRTEMQPYALWSLENALKQGKWDYISLQGILAYDIYGCNDPKTLGILIGRNAAPLLDHFHRQHPYAQLIWHNTGTFEIGRVAGEKVYTEESLARHDADKQTICDYMCSEFVKDRDYDLMPVNSGAAWPIARAENAKLAVSLIPEGGLCARLGVRNEKTFPYFTDNPDAGDGYHDGDIGGGQFLNACVWYETLTGQSCLDNPYKPTLENGKYQLSDALVQLLRKAAHDAVS